MRVLEAEAVVSARDATGAVFANISNKIRQIQTAANQVSGVGGTIANVSKKVETAGKKLTAVGRGLSVGVTLPAAFAAKRGFDTVLQFEKELNKAQALGELTEEQRKLVEGDARAIGRDTQFTAKQAVEMIRTFIQAGRTVEQARGLARPALDFAKFGDVDPKQAADVITSVASAYRLALSTVEEAQAAGARVGDIVAKAANISRADVADLAQGFKFAAPLAKLAGVSMEQLAAAIATMANNGLRGDEAGVAIRSMLVRLVAPTTKANAALAELGLTFAQFAAQKPISIDALISSLEQAGISAKGSREAIEKLVTSPKFAKNRGDLIPALTDVLIKGSDLDTPENREKITEAVGAYLLANAESIDVVGFVKALIDKQVSAGQLARIFDQRQGGRIATLLSPEFSQNVEKLVREAPGSSARGARIMEQGLPGAQQRFLSASENLILSIAKSGVLDTVTNTLNSLAKGINSLAETNPKVLEFATQAVLAAAALGPLAFVVGKLATGGAALARLIALVVPAAAAAPAAFAAAGPQGAAVGGAALTALLLTEAHRRTFGRSDGFSPQDIIARLLGIGGESLKPLTLDGVRAAIEGTPIKAELEGQADVNVTIKVEPSDGFWAQVKSFTANVFGNLRVNGGVPPTGTSGSTGLSMPEAIPGAP